MDRSGPGCWNGPAVQVRGFGPDLDQTRTGPDLPMSTTYRWLWCGDHHSVVAAHANSITILREFSYDSKEFTQLCQVKVCCYLLWIRWIRSVARCWISSIAVEGFAKMTFSCLGRQKGMVTKPWNVISDISYFFLSRPLKKGSPRLVFLFIAHLVSRAIVLIVLQLLLLTVTVTMLNSHASANTGVRYSVGIIDIKVELVSLQFCWHDLTTCMMSVGPPARYCLGLLQLFSCVGWTYTY